ncbi:hypothetical protein EEL50_12960 [Muribaculaceae bacterium Isolate-105 (HZI)]|uniref:hypothetical protein n=1 Tax=uncultured Bacteroides sp. TaxID=162156 RepID=UPI000F4860E8|nr:hypothetical protein [uncultured Bacteroides sp.]ROT11821.1 hypothetical protein EEL50_12960 [Muribaculaceae bacterium Isolate-105 (HZI)]
MAKKKKHKKDSDVNLPIIMDYGIGCISVYDPVAMLPYSEPPITEQTRFKKLGKEMKAEFKWLAASITIEFWEENRQIPFGEEMSKLRIRLMRMFAEEYRIQLKEDTELKDYLQTLVINTINKQLKSEKEKQ